MSTDEEASPNELTGTASRTVNRSDRSFTAA